MGEDEMWKAFYEQSQHQDGVTDNRIQQVDDGFFEKFGSGLRDKEKSEKVAEERVQEEKREREGYAAKEDSSGGEDNDVTARADKAAIEKDPLPALDPDELFCEVLYECLHLVGQDAASKIKKEVLALYLKNIFKLDEAKFKEFVDKVKVKPTPKRFLNVEVVEAKNLTPKDANGLSDPFCVLWISSYPTERFNTSVKQQTLCPRWEENFNIPIDSPTQDVLHFEVWDFDPAETVKDKFSKFSEVKGIWGVKKLMKEIAMTASTGKHDNEIIGSAQITLKNVQSVGQTAWFKLTKKHKNLEQGTILLKMMFGSGKDVRVAFEEHKQLLRTLVNHAMDQTEFEGANWTGEYDLEAEVILRQHLAQSNLGATDDFLARWIEYVNAYERKALNYAVLADISNILVRSLKNGVLNEQERKWFWNSAKKILPHCYAYIRKIRKNRQDEAQTALQLKAILRIFKDLSALNAPQDVDIFPRDSYAWVRTLEQFTIKSLLHEAIVHGACDWFDYLQNHNLPDENSEREVLQYYVRIARIILSDLERAWERYEMVFKEGMNFPYSKTLYAIYAMNLVELIKPNIEDLAMSLKPLDFELDSNEGPIAAGTSLFELYLKLQEMNKLGARIFDSDPEFETFELRKCAKWFYSGVATWLDIAAYKSLLRVKKAVELDTFQPVNSCVKYSSSPVDAMSIFHQIRELWTQLDYPDVEESYTFIAKIIDDLCKCSVTYSDCIAARVENMGFVKSGGEIHFHVTDEWCYAINNIEYLYHSIRPFVKELGTDKILENLANFNNEITAEHCRNTLELVMSNAIENVGHKIAELLQTLAQKMCPSMLKFLQEGAELLHQQSNILDHLMGYLDESLTILHGKLTEDNFNRILDSIWDMLAVMLRDMVQIGIEKRRPPSYFGNLRETLQILVGFFKQEKESEKRVEILSKVEKTLQLYGMETADLIHWYYVSERLPEQTAMNKATDGTLLVELQFQGNKLNVGVLSARNIRPMDSNGLCDPFVTVCLIPKHKLSDHSKHQTKVIKKTLSPLFEAYFSFDFPRDHGDIPNNALVMFVVKDQDLFGAKKDYVGEAFAAVKEANDAEQGYPKRLTLNLSRPSKNADSEILKALDFRQGDKQAKDFVKKQKKRGENPGK